MHGSRRGEQGVHHPPNIFHAPSKNVSTPILLSSNPPPKKKLSLFIFNKDLHVIFMKNIPNMCVLLLFLF